MPNEHETLGSLFTDIADAIRAKTGGSASITADNFPSEIASIPSGGGTLITKNITANGTYNAEDDDADGYSSVTVDVPRVDLERKISATLGKLTEQTPGGNWYAPNNYSYTPFSPCTDADTLLSVNLYGATSFRFISKFKVSAFKETNPVHTLFGVDYSSQIYSYVPFIFAFNYSGGSAVYAGMDPGTFIELQINHNLAVDTWYYVALRCANSTATFCLYDADGTLLGSQTAAFTSMQSRSVHPCIGGCAANGSYRADNTIFDLDECYIEKNDTALWGSTNAKTASMGIVS